MRVFLQKLKHHRAQKDISGALDQFHSSIFLTETHRAILTSHVIILALSNRCVQQGFMTKNTKQNKKRLISYKTLQAELIVCDE